MTLMYHYGFHEFICSTKLKNVIETEQNSETEHNAKHEMRTKVLDVPIHVV